MSNTDAIVAADRWCFMCPGQGSQYVGMYGRLLGEEPGARERLEEAGALLDRPLLTIIEEGPKALLGDTAQTQPALLCLDVLCAEALLTRGFEPAFVMGHSLGQWAALVIAGSLEFADALRLVARRGELMAAAGSRVSGGMAACVSVDPQVLDDLVAELGQDQVLEITNDNAPGQVTLSGQREVLDRAVNRINKQRLGRAVMLPVSAPFHSSLMQPVADDFAAELASLSLAPPRVPFIDTVTGALASDPEGIRRGLVAQLVRPVLWVQAVTAARQAGADRYVECGPRKVLCGLVKRIHSDSERSAAEDLLRRI